MTHHSSSAISPAPAESYLAIRLSHPAKPMMTAENWLTTIRS